MRLLTGDECGLLKEYVPEIASKRTAKATTNGDGKPGIILPVAYDVAKINNCHGIQRVDPNETQTRARAVIDMVFCGTPETEEQFSYAALRANGSVEIWQGRTPTEHKKKFASHQRVSLSGDIFEKSRNETDIPNVPVKPLGLVNVGSKGRLCACDTHGNLVVLKTDPADIHKPVSVVQQFATFQNNEDNISLSYTKGKVMNTQLASAMVADTTNGRVAIGGRERDIRLFDIETGKPIWKAKNLSPDPQTLLQQPIWPSAMAFVNPEDSNLLAVGTAFGQLRLYDVRSNNRRPIRYSPENFVEHRITAVCQVESNQVVVGDTTGDIHALDLRKNLNAQRGNKQIDGSDSLGRYVGPAGSIRQLVKHERLPILAAVGCDRMLRTYNTQTQKAIDCVYLKQRLNCVLFCAEGRTDDFAEDEEDFVNEEDVNMDQEDVVKDYVDSSSDGDSDSDDDEDVTENKGPYTPSIEPQRDSDDSSSENENVKKDSESGSQSSDSEADDANVHNRSSDESESASESEDGSEEDKSPRKRRRR